MLEARAAAAGRVAEAMQRAGTAEAAFNLNARNAIATTQMLASKEDAAAKGARELANAMELVQREMDRTAASGTRLAVSTQNMSATLRYGGQSAGAQRFAYTMLGQQLQDVAIQAQLGVNPLIILTQQGTQAAYAMQGLGGAAGKVGKFFSNPWVAALLAGTTALSMLYASLKDSEAATNGLAMASDGLSETQSVLGGMFDMVSGKLLKQNELLKLNAQLRLINLRTEAETAASQARSTASGVGLAKSKLIGIGAVGEYDPSAAASQYRDSAAAATRVQKLLQDTLKGADKGGIEGVEALKRVDGKDLESLNIRLNDFQAAITQAVEARYKAGVADALERSLSSGVLVESLRKPDTSKPKKDNTAEQAAREAERLASFYDTTAERIQRVNERFDEQPRLIDQTSQAARELDAIMAELEKRKPAGFEQLINEAQKAKVTVQEALDRPFKQLVEQAKEREEIEKLILQGHQGAADALAIALQQQRAGRDVSAEQLKTILSIVQAERTRGQQTERQARAQQDYLSALNGVRSTISGGIAGAITGRGGGDIGQALTDQFATLFANRITDQLFSGIFDKAENQITRGGTDVRQQLDLVSGALRLFAKDVTEIRAMLSGDPAGTEVAGGARAAGAAIASASAGAATLIARAMTSVPAAGANDNAPTEDWPTTIVTGSRHKGPQSNPIELLGSKIERTLERVFKPLGDFFKDHADGGGLGLLSGQMLLGSNNSKIGSFIGGALGEKAGEKLAAGAFGKALGKFGEFLGPLGSIAGGLLGGLVGGLFAGPKPSASGVITSVNGAAQITGNNKEQQAAVSGVSVNVQSTLQRIIDQLGGSAGAFDVSIGKREDYYRVAGTNTTAVGDKHPERGTGVTLLYNGTDANEALRIAVLEAFRDGAVQGIREGSRRLLTNNQDIEIGVGKASRFEQVFKDLKRYTDPAGAALDALNQKFRQLKDLFGEAGASAQEYADLQKLYEFERTDALKQVTEQVTASLKSFLSQLTTGDTGLSLRTRQTNALNEYNPLAERVRAGDATAYDAYTQAAQTLLDIQRQIYGSGEEYFASLEQITALAKGTIAREDAKLNAANDRGSFDTAPMVNAIGKQTQDLANVLAPSLSQIAANTASLPALARNAATAGSQADYYKNFGRAANF